MTYRQIQIDWSAYFARFCEVHGSEPVLFKEDKETGRGGWFLFPDGWLYGRNPVGPEMPPQSDKAQVYLIKEYWTIRRNILREDLRVRLVDLRELAKLQSLRSASLTTSKVSISRSENDDDLRTMQQVINNVEFGFLLDEARSVKEKIRECDENLENPQVSETLAQSQTSSMVRASGFTYAGLLSEIDKIEEHGYERDRAM